MWDYHSTSSIASNANTILMLQRSIAICHLHNVAYQVETRVEEKQKATQ